MHLKNLTLKNFMNYDTLTLALPDRGVVSVCGDNGAGKSALIEGLSYAISGKTLRGTDPWREGQAGECCAHVVTSAGEFLIERSRGKSGSPKLSWGRVGEPAVKYDTTTKAQAALDRVVGDWDVWRRASVFSSSDAAHFTLAPDSERKRLLEAVLGIDVFDAALDACRAELKKAENDYAGDARRVAVLEERKAGLVRRAEDAKNALIALKATDVVACSDEDIKTLEAQYVRDRTSLTKVDAEVANVRRSLEEAQRAGTLTEGAARALYAQLEKLRGDVCPTCGQAIAKAHKSRLEKELQAEKIKGETARGASDRLATLAREELVDLQAERDVFGQRVIDAEHVLAVSKSRRGDATRLTEAYAAAQVELQKTEEEHARLVSSTLAATLNLLEMRAAETVLGVRGVRTQVVARALGGIEAATNAYLSRIADPGVALRLRSYTEQKSGKVVDSLSLDVEGLADGKGYKGCSSGQRRRVDVALLLAFGEVAAAAMSTVPGTLFIDEVFDSLDDGGIERVEGIIRELAADRCVVVITHVGEVVSALRPDRRLWAAGGHLA